MLQVLIDPSMLTAKPDHTGCELSIAISGCSWTGEIPRFDDSMHREEFLERLLPWKWTPPKQVKIVWVNEENKALKSDLIDIFENGDPSYQPDHDEVIGYYESIIKDKVYVKDSNVDINPQEILTDTKHDVSKETVINITDPVSDLSVPPDPSVPTHFLTSTIAQFAQKLVPHNTFGKLVFFAKGPDVYVPAMATGYFVVPVGFSDEMNWSSEVRIFYMENETEKELLPYPDHNDGEPVILTPINRDYVRAKYFSGTSQTMELICPVTSIKVSEDENAPVQLRDKDGSFLGHVKNIEVHDSELLFQRPVFIEKILSKLAECFNVTALFHEFLYANKEILLRQNSDWFKDINTIFKIILRDSVGIGNPLYDNGQTLLLEIIKAYNHLDEVTKIEIKEEEIISQLAEYDKITPENWTSANYLQQEFLNPEITLLETVMTDITEEELSKWFSYWEKVISKVQTCHKNDLIKIQLNNFFETLLPATEKPSIDTFKTAVDDYFENNFIVIENSFLKSLAIRINQYEYGFQNEEIQNLKKDTITYIKNYVNERIFPGTVQQANPFTLYPAASQEITDFVSNGELTWKSLNEFIENYFNAEAKNRKWIQTDVDKVLNETLKNTTEIPPQVLIKADSLEMNRSIVDLEEDLSNEISGHIILQQRAQAINQNDFTGKEWKTLNFSKIDLADDQENIIRLKETYLIPAFLPEENDFKTTCFSISNENLSIIAGHHNFDDADFKGEAQMPFRFSYLFDNGEDENPNSIPPAYALWYGYHYNFAGFVVLNSGVIPTLLRKNEDDWITPEIGYQEIDPLNIKNYHHLRRVAVGKAHVEIKKFKSIPKGLLPLSCELPEWQEQPVYLLSNHQEEISIEIGKPGTNFWNWYAWLGETNPYLNPCLIREMQIKQTDIKEKQVNEYLVDPAVDDELIVVIEQLFPVKKMILTGNRLDTITLKLTEKEGIGIKENIKVKKGDGTEITIDHENNIINIPYGFVANIRIHSKVAKKYFEGNTIRFHKWMEELYKPVKSQYASDDNELDLSEFDEFYFTESVELFVEAAIPKNKIIKDNNEYDDYCTFLWQNLYPFETETTKQVALNIIKFNAKNAEYSDHYTKLAYFSRTNVNHQVWHWNGRLFDDALVKIEKLTPEELDPKETTTEAMKWESWEFSDRPDSSALEYTTYLKAGRTDPGKDKIQTLFTDNRIVDNKALYYRFSAELFCRYELLGKEYQISVQSFTQLKEEKTVKNQWKRYVKKSNKSDSFPRPAIRFAIPLTHSIEECRKSDGIISASVLIVLKDTWFSEAGLAEKMEVGIDVLKYQKEKLPVEMYLNAGNDPILSGNGIRRVEVEGKSYYEPGGETSIPKVVFEPAGPAGLTFDLAASTPKIIGSSFILHVNNINHFMSDDSDPLKAWSMAQIAVRRSLHDHLWSLDKNDIGKVRSDWSAKEWVQFLPDTNSMIPLAWRKEAANYGSVQLNLTHEKIAHHTSGMPQFPDSGIPNTYEQRTERYIIITEKIQNMGGQPFEKYQAVYKYTDQNDFKHNDGELLNKDSFEGYARILIVRVMPESSGDASIWSKLFGEDKEFDFAKIQNDPDAALPIISKRIPVRIEKEQA